MFVARWAVATGDRLTRHVHNIREFDNETAAVAAIQEPFGPHVVAAHVVYIPAVVGGPGYRLIADRKRGNKLRRHVAAAHA